MFIYLMPFNDINLQNSQVPIIYEGKFDKINSLKWYLRSNCNLYDVTFLRSKKTPQKSDMQENDS